MYGNLPFSFMHKLLTMHVNSFIPDLDGSFIHALAVTAPDHQVTALRDVILKYVRRESSLRVSIPVSG